MQQGRVLRTALVCLLLCVALCLLFCHWAVPQSGPGNWWPASSAPASALSLGASNRPIIIEKLPPLPEQGLGPATTRWPKPAGQQTVLWNTRNQAGALVPSGQYLLQVTAVAEDGQRNTVLSSFLLHR